MTWQLGTGVTQWWLLRRSGESYAGRRDTCISDVPTVPPMPNEVGPRLVRRPGVEVHRLVVQCNAAGSIVSGVFAASSATGYDGCMLISTPRVW
jgi:hypothetical protein